MAIILLGRELRLSRQIYNTAVTFLKFLLPRKEKTV